jgi:hypothetical protein
MANQEIDLTGSWLSRYEYGEDKYSEHRVNLRQDRLNVNGSSELDNSSSELFLYLQLIGATTLGGKWKEKTSKKGEYGGQEFVGWVAFVLKNEVTLAEGIWIGPNRHGSAINSGVWTLDKIQK